MDKEKLEHLKKNLHKRFLALRHKLERVYDKYQVDRIRKKKQYLAMKRKLSQKEYLAYRLEKLKKGGWVRIAILAAVLFLLLFFCVKAVLFVAGKMGSREKTAVETETETEAVFPEKDITIGSTGCMLLHSPFIDSYPDAQGNYDFSSIYQYITPYYSEPDFMTCEFEGALGGEELGYSGYPAFKSPDVIIENIRDSGVDLQMLATNHIYDAWSDGFHRTMEVYEEKQIAYTGIRKTEQEKQYYIADINGIPVGFINYVYETTGNGTNLNGIPLAQEDWELVNAFDYDDLDSFYAQMQRNIDAMKADGARFLIANMHWGNEYQLQEADYQREIAQKLCDMGIDALIGGHPHCEQPIDVFSSSDNENTMFCIFSVGNALSNQRIYLMDEMPTGHTEDGVMVTLHLHQDTAGNVELSDVELLPTWVYRYQDNAGSKYFILPLDDVANIEKTTGISGIRQEAQASYDRTMEELEPGLQKAKKAFGAEEASENSGVHIGI